MINKNLEEILIKKKEKEKSKVEIDWPARKDQWLKLVKELYDQIIKWLDPYIKKELLNINCKKIRLSEEYIGSYEIDEMVIKMPDEKVTLTPIGSLIIGAHGRVDMQGDKGKAMFLLVGEKQERPMIETRVYTSEEERKKGEEERKKETVTATVKYIWKLATSPPRIEYMELTPDLFSDLFSQVIHG